jgi:hypothetical protein
MPFNGVKPNNFQEFLINKAGWSTKGCPTPPIANFCVILHTLYLTIVLQKGFLFVIIFI